MMQLSYEPALDAYHATFRFLRIRERFATISVAVDIVRIVDFYLLFPQRLDSFRVLPNHRWLKKLGKTAARESYAKQPSDIVLFSRMEEIQLAALETLASAKFIIGAELEKGCFSNSGKRPTEPLWRMLQDANSAEDDLLDGLVVMATEYDLEGPNGLKARTGLMEFRYDAI